MLRLFRRLAFTAALGVVLVMMLRPVPEMAEGTNDKLDHFVIFVGLAVIGVWALVPLGWLVVGLAGYGVLTEILQTTLTSDRQGDPKDVVADVLGVLLVVLGVAVFRRARGASSGPGRPPG